MPKLSRIAKRMWVDFLNWLSGGQLRRSESEARRLNAETMKLYKTAQKLTSENEKRYVVLKPFDVTYDGSGNIVDGDPAFFRRMYELSGDPALLFFFYVFRESVFKKMLYASADKNMIFLGMINCVDTLLSEINRYKITYLNMVAEEEATHGEI